MKKILSILTVLCICGISAFAQNTAPKENIMKDKKVLVAFFSRTGENYNVGNISKGNTHIIAEMIAGETNGKLFQIEPVKPIPMNTGLVWTLPKQKRRTRPGLP